MRSFAALLAGIVVMAGLVSPARSAVWAGPETKLAGAGSTFMAPMNERWTVEYQKLHAQVKIDYQGIGSGGGIKAITDKTVAFAGSDAPLNKKEVEAMGGAAAVLEFPVLAGGVVPAYSVPGINQVLNFDGALLAEIFMGKVSNWNDPKIAKLNPGAQLPDLAITPAWRTDGSGTTFVFTNYLATQSEEFKTTVGLGKQVKWPVGQGGKGNPGVAAVIQQTPGAIGYIEQNFAASNQIAYGAVKNQAGKFVRASIASISAAGGAAASGMKERLTADIWNQPGEASYPISAFAYLIVYRDLSNLPDRDHAEALSGFLKWITTDGQKLCSELDYAPLSDDVRAKVTEAVSKLTYKGSPLTSGH